MKGYSSQIKRIVVYIRPLVSFHVWGRVSTLSLGYVLNC